MSTINDDSGTDDLSDDDYNLLVQQVHDFSLSCQNHLDAVALVTAAGLPMRESAAAMLSVMGGPGGVMRHPGRLLAVTTLLARFCSLLVNVATIDDQGNTDTALHEALISTLLSDAPAVNAQWITENGEPA